MGPGGFPFYWTQLADYGNEESEPGDSSWAELRESQTISLQKVRNGERQSLLMLEMDGISTPATNKSWQIDCSVMRLQMTMGIKSHIKAPFTNQ